MFCRLEFPANVDLFGELIYRKEHLLRISPKIFFTGRLL